jgi:hypothetical protein
MSQDGLVLGGNVRANNVGLDEDLLPVLLDGLLGEVVLLNLELLLLEQVANVLIVLLGEGVGSIDNALNLNGITKTVPHRSVADTSPCTRSRSCWFRSEVPCRVSSFR